MKLWDQAWLKLLEREGIDVALFYRYVDDARNMLHPLIEGWRWDGFNFTFSKQWEEDDINSNKSDTERTTEELAKAMSSIVWFLEFEGEHKDMFPNKRLPTLDTELWIDESGAVKYSFFEKTMCPNRVIQSNTALSENSIRSSLVQEVIRRLKNCSVDLPLVEVQSILSTFGQKLINSGHSVMSSRYVLVHGMVKFTELKRLSSLPAKHADHKPLYNPKENDVFKRKLPLHDDFVCTGGGGVWGGGVYTQVEVEVTKTLRLG